MSFQESQKFFSLNRYQKIYGWKIVTFPSIPNYFLNSGITAETPIVTGYHFKSELEKFLRSIFCNEQNIEKIYIWKKNFFPFVLLKSFVAGGPKSWNVNWNTTDSSHYWTWSMKTSFNRLCFNNETHIRRVSVRSAKVLSVREDRGGPKRKEIEVRREKVVFF